MLCKEKKGIHAGHAGKRATPDCIPLLFWGRKRLVLLPVAILLEAYIFRAGKKHPTWGSPIFPPSGQPTRLKEGAEDVIPSPPNPNRRRSHSGGRVVSEAARD